MSVYQYASDFKKRYPKTIAWRIKKHCDVVEAHIGPDEVVKYAFACQKNPHSYEIFRTFVIADEGESKAVYEDLLQLTATNQSMRQQTGIVDSHDILVVNVDLEASIQIQILLQILLALIAEFELL